MINYLYAPIIVTGCARSGTSLLAGILANCGAWTGKVTGPTHWNRKGQFENEFIRDTLTKGYLKQIGADPMGQDPLPVMDEYGMRQHGAEWRKKVIACVLGQGYRADGPWMVKGAKACLIWPVWAEAFPQARWVIARRDDERIIDSCMKTSFMRKRRTRESWQEWIDHHKECWRSMGRRVGNLEIWSDHVVKSVQYDDFTISRWMVESCGLVWDEAKVKQFVDPQLWSG